MCLISWGLNPQSISLQETKIWYFIEIQICQTNTAWKVTRLEDTWIWISLWCHCEIKTVTPNLSFLSLMYIHSFIHVKAEPITSALWWRSGVADLLTSFWFYYKCETTYLCHLESIWNSQLNIWNPVSPENFSANIFKKLWLQTPGSGIPGRSLIIHSLSLTESYQELPVASALVRRQRENTGHVIPVWRLFLLKNKTTTVVTISQKWIRGNDLWAARWGLTLEK